MKQITEKDIRIVKVNGKYGYQYPDGEWLADPQFDRACPFEGGRAVVVKDGYEGWLSFDEDEGDYFPWQEQYRALDRIRKRNERKKRLRRMLGLAETKPMKTTSWTDEDEDDGWFVRNLKKAVVRFKKEPVIPVTIIFGTFVLIYTFFFE